VEVKLIITHVIFININHFQASSSGTRVNSLIDNPCVARNKDGQILVADFNNKQCYMQKATNSINIYGASLDGNGYFPPDGWTSQNWTFYRSVDKCIRNGIYFYPNQKVIYDSTCDDAGCSNRYATCKLYTISYTCDSLWNKLNNSICEYREPF
jgi:hypothetical protein